MPYIRRILCIDDDPDALRVLCEYLKLEGYEVVAAQDGTRGIQMLSQEEVQLVITDLNMPGLTGMDVIDIVRKNYPRLQIMVVTGYGTIETVLEALHKGAVDYLVKPYLLEILKLSLGKAERQIEIEERLRLAEEQGPPLADEKLLEALPAPCALMDANANWLAWNPAFEEMCGGFGDRGPMAGSGRHQEKIRELVLDADPERSLMLTCAGPEERVLELFLRPVRDTTNWLLVGETVLPEADEHDPDGEELVLVLSPSGLVLWANPVAVDQLGIPLDAESTAAQLLRGTLAPQLLSTLNAPMPATFEREWDGELKLNERNGRCRVMLSPLLDESNRRQASILRICRWHPYPPEAALDRGRQVEEGLLLLRLDASGRIEWLSEAFGEESGLGISTLEGRKAEDVLKPIGDGGRLWRLGLGSGLRLEKVGDMPLASGRLLEYRALDPAPIAMSIEQQKEQLERASSLLSHLLSEAGTDDVERLQTRLTKVARTIVNTGDFTRAVLVLKPDEDIIGWGHAGYTEEDALTLAADPAGLDQCMNGNGVCREIGPAKLFTPDPGEEGTASYLLMPVRGRDGREVGWLRLEGPDSGESQQIERLRLVEMVLHNVALSMDELELERKVARSEARYQDLYENARYSILITDSENGRILDMNHEAEQLTGYRRHELIGKRIWEIRDEAFQEEARSNWLMTLRREQTSFDNVPLRQKDGTLIYVEYDCMFSELDGRPVVQSFYRDVTEKQALEFSLIQSQKLAGLGQLSAGIAHELRNPLGIMASSLFYLNTVLNKEEIKVPDQVHKHLGILKAEMERSRKIIENLLSFSRTSSHEREVVDLNELLVQTLDLVRKELLVNNIRLVTELDDLPVVHLNLDELKQAFLNIILNSTQAMPDGGQLRVSSKLERGKVQISFEDTGQGISKQDLANVLNPFFTTKDPGLGTGLGLSLTHSFIKRAGGDLIIESELDVGTTVRVYLSYSAEEYE